MKTSATFLALILLVGCSSPGYQTNGATWTFSPDGTQVAFLTAIDATSRGILAIQPVTGGAQVQIASDVQAGSFRFSPDGSQLAYLDGSSTLLVAPATGGAAIPIATDVGNVWFTPGGTRVVFEQGCASSCALVSAPTSGGSKVTLNAAVPPYVGLVGTSADGSQLVLWDSALNLWTVPIDGGLPFQIAAGASGCQLTPDQKQVAFMVGHTLKIAPIEGAGATGVVLGEGVDIGGALLSPDGTRAVFFQSLTRNLFSTATTGGRPAQIATNVSSGISFSPDGSLLSLTRNGDSNGFGSLETMPATGGTSTPIATGAGRAWFYAGGSRLLFLTHFDPTTGSGTLETAAATGGPAITISNGAAVISLAPDGTQVAFGLGWDSTWNRGSLATAPIAGGPTTQIASEVSDFKFSPNGKHLGFRQNVHALSSSSLAGVGTIKIVPVGGGAIVKITEQ